MVYDITVLYFVPCEYFYHDEYDPEAAMQQIVEMYVSRYGDRPSPREQVISALKEGERELGEIQKMTSLDLSGTFQTLRILRREGLVKEEDNLRWVLDSSSQKD